MPLPVAYSIWAAAAVAAVTVLSVPLFDEPVGYVVTIGARELDGCLGPADSAYPVVGVVRVPQLLCRSAGRQTMCERISPH